MDLRTYKPYTLVGPLALQLVLAPLSVHSSTTDYICQNIFLLQLNSRKAFSSVNQHLYLLRSKTFQKFIFQTAQDRDLTFTPSQVATCKLLLEEEDSGIDILNKD